MVSIFFSTSILAQQSGSIDVVKESRQILQMAEYIGVDYSEAVTNGEIANEDEFAEMQQFASLILQKSATLQTANKADFDLRQTSVVANARALQQAILEKYTIEKIQVLTQQIRQQLLALSPALLLPTQLLAQSQVQTLFADNCAACHGSTGEGNGPLAKSFSPSPTNFTETKRALNRSLLGLYDAISAGLEDTAMRAFTELNDQQRWSLAFYAGSLAFSQDTNQHKQTDKKTVPKIALQSWINNNPAQLANDHGELTLDQITQWRAIPEFFFSQADSPIATTKTNLIAAVAAYRDGNLSQAQTLAVSAYLDGFELIENNLDARDSVLRKSVENQLLNFRNVLDVASNDALVVKELQHILQQLELVDNTLTGEVLSNNAMFSASLIILLREGLEALLVVLALITVLIKTKRQDAIRYVHVGWISALVAGGFTWWAAENIIDISGSSRELMEGGAALLAAGILFYVGYWMHSKTKATQWQQYIQNNVERHLSTGTLWGLTGLAFISVYREVFETILFYQSLLTQAVGDGSQSSYVWYGLVAAVAIIMLITWGMLKYSLKLPIGRFFAISSYFMLALAFVLAGKGVSALQEAAVIPIATFPFDITVRWLGISATWQGVLTQGVIMIFVVIMLACRDKKTSTTS
ncbi:cytochrome c/FTR1 family iron permease [Flavobacterium sp. W21_SRS_FM6]|uniref:cytochrome c/FTR1 family iron permease n=1 Tax=Flavobacterium sp. W21_SRS_FM6 TaxID=3240268 RepID=UPI003F8F663F